MLLYRSLLLHGVGKCAVIPILEAETTHADHYNYTYILASDDK